MLITVIMTPCHWYLTWARQTQTSSHPLTLKSISVSPFQYHLRLNIQRGIFTSAFGTKTLFTSSRVFFAFTQPADPLLLDLIVLPTCGTEQELA